MNQYSEKLALLQKERKNNSSQVTAAAQSIIPGPCSEMDFSYQPRNELPSLKIRDSCLILPGEIAMLLAAPGVGKTANGECIAAAFIADRYKIPDVDTFGYSVHSKGKKLLICDTERTADDCSKTYHNIFKRLSMDPKLLTSDEKKLNAITHLVMAEIGSAELLRETLGYYLSSEEYEFVIIDGILDFCLSMLDDKDSANVVRWLRALAVKYNCSIVVTIHPNKGTQNPAGHIGAFLLRWCRAVLLIKPTSDKNIKEIVADFDHGKLSHDLIGRFEPVYFSWNDSKEMMTSCQAPAPPAYKVNFLKQAVMELRLRGTNEIPSAKLKEHYGKLAGIKPDTAKKHIAKAVADGLLISIGEGKSTRYLPATDWNIPGNTDSGIDAPYIDKGAIPESDTWNAKSPHDTRIDDNGYPNEWK
jgi:hypothetical protein